MMKKYDVIVIGGGLAGLTAAIHLAQESRSVCVFEKENYPHHKVCGEYVSNEIVPYLESLGVSLTNASVAIDTLQLSMVKGQDLELKLPVGGIGISRYLFDDLLYQKALDLGVTFVLKTVTAISYSADSFECKTGDETIYYGEIAIGAYGKRSNIDKQLNRNFINQKSSWLGVKCHYECANFPENKVALHNFNGGYGGLSKIENGQVNFCYLASYQSFKRFKGINDFNREVVCENPFLRDFLKDATPTFEQPLAIAQISFEEKDAVENHILMCGDSAGLIHPLCGNGMAMAIHSAKIATESILQYFENENYSRQQLEADYRLAWKYNFEKRLKRGRQLQSILLNKSLSKLAMATVAKSSWLLKNIITQTHGKPIEC